MNDGTKAGSNHWKQQSPPLNLEKIDCKAIAERLVTAAKNDKGDWELRVHGRRHALVQESTYNAYVVVHTSSEATVIDYLQVIRQLLEEGIREELRKAFNQQEAKAA